MMVVPIKVSLTSPLHRMQSSMQGYSGQVLHHQDPVCPYAGWVELTNDGPGPSTSARGASHMGGASVPLVCSHGLHAESSFQKELMENNAQNTVPLHQLQVAPWPDTKRENWYEWGHEPVSSYSEVIDTTALTDAYWQILWFIPQKTYKVEPWCWGDVECHTGPTTHDDRCRAVGEKPHASTCVRASEKLGKEELLHSILTEKGRCNYVSLENKPYDIIGSKEDHSQAWHWLILHAVKEATDIRAKILTMAQATIITMEVRQNAALAYMTECPIGQFQKKGQTRSYVRPEEMKKHLESCSKKHAGKHGTIA